MSWPFAGLLVQLGINYELIRSEYPPETIVKQFTFNSARKSMSTVIPLPRGGYRLLTKGASEIVLDKCTHIIGNNGDVSGCGFDYDRILLFDF